MQQFFDNEEFNNEQNSSSNYPVETDDSFTPDQIQEIDEYKELVRKKIAKNDSVLRGLETFFWGISSYSLCKWFVLTLGSSGINLAIALALVVNQIVNRDCLDSFNANKKDGRWELTGMGKLFRFLFGFAASGFVIWASVGNFVNMVQDSKTTYYTLNAAIEEFNSYPKKQQEELLTGGVIGASLVALIYIGIGLNKK